MQLKICLLSREYPPETAWGGIATYTHTLAHGLSEAGHLVHVISLSQDKDEYIQYDGLVTVHRVKPVKWLTPLGYFGFSDSTNILNYSIRVALKFRELNDHEQFDIVESPDFNAEGLILSLISSLPLITRIHGSHYEINLVNKENPSLDLMLTSYLESKLVRRSIKVATFSKFSTNFVLNLYHLASNKVIYAQAGIKFPEDKDVFALEPSEKRTVLFVGRLSYRKGINTLLQAIPKVIAKFPDVHFIIAGADRPSAPGGRYYRQYFEECIADEYSQSVVVWKGVVRGKKLDDLYRNCDIFVAPSLYETFGFVHLEAMSYGKPVVACQASATTEVVSKGECGILIEPSNSDQLAEAIIILLSDNDLRMRMGENAFARSRVFSADVMVDKSLALYKLAIEEFNKQELS
jgi:glycosyltransferase involved in cell wall biosynthesis